MNAGYVYVLANSITPDIAYVGTTTHLPEDHAEGLWRSTGEPVPHLVVYAQRVADCGDAARCLREALERRGMVVHKPIGEGFIRARVAEVVAVVAECFSRTPSGSPESLARLFRDAAAMVEEGPFPVNYLTGRYGEEARAYWPWWSAWEDAEEAYALGRDGGGRAVEAVELHRGAARLGCVLSYARLGDMHRDGIGVQENLTEALRWYREGARKGNYLCHLRVASLHAERGFDGEARASLVTFYRDRLAGRSLLIEDELDVRSEIIASIAPLISLYRNPPDRVVLDGLLAEREELLFEASSRMDAAREAGQSREELFSLDLAWTYLRGVEGVEADVEAFSREVALGADGEVYCPFCGQRLYDTSILQPGVGEEAHLPAGCPHKIFVYVWGRGVKASTFLMVRRDYAEALVAALEASEEYRENAAAYARGDTHAEAPLDEATKEAFAAGRGEGWGDAAGRVNTFVGSRHYRRFSEVLPGDTLVFMVVGDKSGLHIGVAPNVLRETPPAGE